MSIYLGGLVEDYSAMQGPCSSGFHIPTTNEWQALGTLSNSLGVYTNFPDYIKLPKAGDLHGDNGNRYNAGSYRYYRSCTNQSNNSAYCISLSSNTYQYNQFWSKYMGLPIRPFKDIPAIPDSNWTTIYQGTGSAGIFHNSSLGLISMSSDGSTRYTIADKNLGATTVWNNGDSLTAANCGGYFQWGNNYMFPFSGATTTLYQSVSASGYGPGNYYSDSTFRIKNPRDSSYNDNLRGGTTGVVSKIKEPQHIYMMVDMQFPTTNMLAYYPLVSDANDHKADLGATGTTYNGTWVGTASYTTAGSKTSANFTSGSNRINTGVTIGSLPFTICAWSYFTSMSYWHCLIGNPTSNQSDGYAIRAYNYGSQPYRPFVCNGTSSDVALDNNLFKLNTWQFIAYTVDSSSTKFYIDGVLKYTGGAGGPASGYGTFYLASYGTGETSQGWNGNIKDVAIYNKVLTQAEITEYYEATK